MIKARCPECGMIVDATSGVSDHHKYAFIERCYTQTTRPLYGGGSKVEICNYRGVALREERRSEDSTGIPD